MNDRPTLVTGATGFLGAHVVAAAVARAQRDATMAEPLGRLVVGTGREIDAAPRYTTPRDAAQWIAASLPEELDALLERVQPSEVVHCAALSRAGDCQVDPDLARALNVDLPAALATWCAAHDARLVHVSTDLVFGAEDAPREGFAEDAPPAPVSVYGETKLEGERAVLTACPSAVVTRLPLLYGDSGARGRGASDSLLEAVERDARPPLFADEWRTPLEVRCAADALAELLDHDVSGVLHVAGPDRISRYELGLAVLDAMGVEHPAEHLTESRQADVDAGAPRPRDVSLDARRAARLLDTPLLGVRAGLERAMT